MRKKISFLILAFFVINIFACKCVQTQKEINKLPPAPVPPALAPQAPVPQVHHQEVPYAQALAYAQKNLVHEGTLVQQSDGYAYVKVDDRYIHDLFPLLHAEPDYKKPPYFRRKNAPGAHISVAYGDEHIKLKEVGQRFSFSIKDIVIVSPKKNVSYIILQVESPALEALRKSYGLGPKLQGHEFHISLAKKES